MEITIEESAINRKTKELCQAILDQPNMRTLRGHIDAFMADEKARSQYEGLVNKHEALQQKQQMSMPVSDQEVDDFEAQRKELLNNPVARNFLDARQELHQVQESIQTYVNKTLELGRMPTDEDFDSGSCGSGCGCHH